MAHRLLFKYSKTLMYMKLYKIRNLFFVFIILLALQSCCFPPEVEPLTIAISKESKNYPAWLSRYEDNIVYKNLYTMGIDSALKVLSNSDGLLLTGGADIYPSYYNQIEDTALCGGFDRYRDSLEFSLIKKAMENKIPILGVCRGQQILNVSLGGSLYVDIPTEFDTTVTHQQEDWRNCFHTVYIVDSTLLLDLSGVNYGQVTSNHHQGIKDKARDLKISAYSGDSLPEAIEWTNRGEKGFLMAVQWHPERMDTVHLLSAPIARKFLNEAWNYKDKKDKK